MSGYDKSPDYGGPEPPKWFWLLIMALIFSLFMRLVIVLTYA